MLKFLWLLALTAGQQAMPTSSSLEEKLDAIFKDQLSQGQMVGFSVAVVTEGKLSLLKQYGYANLEQKTPVTKNSEFAIGSVSKQFTAACLLLLQEDHKLSLSDPVSEYFPDLTQSSKVTVRDLLNHVSGYRDWYPLDYIDRRLTRDIAPEQVAKQYGSMPLDFNPGEYFSYSNTNYLIAALVVEKVSGKSFFEFLSNRILEPLGMTHTLPYANQGPDFTERYTRFFQGPQEVADKEAPGWMLGAGGLISTPEDIAKWDIAMMNGKILSADSWDQMFTPRTLSTGEVSTYGLGQNVSIVNGNLMVSHNGGVAGSRTGNMVCLDRKSAVVWTANDDQATVGRLNQIADPEGNRKPMATGGGEVEKSITVQGESPFHAALKFVEQLQQGRANRRGLSSEMNDLLTPKRLGEARSTLAGWGDLLGLTIVSGPSERGNMETTEILIKFSKGKSVPATMMRLPDGRIAEFVF
jgi:D-alanyl-D-alanine carboxypeptidase